MGERGVNEANKRRKAAGAGERRSERGRSEMEGREREGERGGRTVQNGQPVSEPRRCDD